MSVPGTGPGIWFDSLISARPSSNCAPRGSHPSPSDLHVGARHRRRCVDLVLRFDFDGAWHRVSAFGMRRQTARPPIA